MKHLGPKSLGRASQVSTAWHGAVDAYAESKSRVREAPVQALRDQGALLWDGTRMQECRGRNRKIAEGKARCGAGPAAQMGKRLPSV